MPPVPVSALSGNPVPAIHRQHPNNRGVCVHVTSVPVPNNRTVTIAGGSAPIAEWSDVSYCTTADG